MDEVLSPKAGTIIAIHKHIAELGVCSLPTSWIFHFAFALLRFMAAVAPIQTPLIRRESSEKRRKNAKNATTNGTATLKNGHSNGTSNKERVAAKVEPKKLGVEEWDYDDCGACGPDHWLELAECTHLGERQSPIDLQLSRMRILPLDSHPLCLVNYKKPLAGEMVNSGHSIQFLPSPQVEPPEIYGGMLDQNYRFVQYHFHWAQNDNEGSEHTIGGLRYPAELHLVHQGVKDPSKLAVLGVFLKLDDGSKENEEKRKFVFDAEEMEALKKLTEYEQRTALESRHNLAGKLPANCCRDVASSAEHFVSSFVRYNGSLTTPPCTENVIWTVFTDPLLVSREQMSLLRAVKDCRGNVIAKNYRPAQDCCNREMYLMAASDVASKL